MSAYREPGETPIEPVNVPPRDPWWSRAWEGIGRFGRCLAFVLVAGALAIGAGALFDHLPSSGFRAAALGVLGVLVVAFGVRAIVEIAP